MNEPSNYTAYVTPEVNKGRVDAQWTRIAERLPAPRRARGPVLQLAGAIAAVCALAMVWWWSDERGGQSSVWEGSLVASDDAPVNVTLAEGTLIELDPRSEVELLHSGARSVQLSLKSGSARFDVAKRRLRRFSVRLGEVEVLVTGTQFRAQRSASARGERVRVDVEEGTVEVQRGDGAKVRLGAGEHWSTFVGTPADRQERVDSMDGEGQPEPDLNDGREQPEATDADADTLDERDGDESAAGRRQRKRARAEAEPERANLDSAPALFEQANVARRLGQLREAADVYAKLVVRHPRDRRAPLAAFELGRIRMDSLSDARGAIDALEKALKLDSRRAFAEDALARLVLAQEAIGDRRACESARKRYLSRYPDGVHAQHLAERCTGR